MERRKLLQAVRYLVDHVKGPDDPRWGQYLALIRTTQGQFVEALQQALEKVGDWLDLSEAELIRIAQLVPRVRSVVAKKISPNAREATPELAAEQMAAPAVGTSFTSTANVATFPVPIGAPAPGTKKRKRR